MNCPSCGETDVCEFVSGDNRCKSCLSIKAKKYRQSKLGLISIIYASQKQSCKKRGHKPPKYTKEELASWVLSQPNFKKLYKKWKKSGYLREKKPSVDRLKDTKTYSFKNIRLVDFQTNTDKSYEGNKSGENPIFHKIQTPVNQVCIINGGIIKTHKSIHIAQRETNIQTANIWKCCVGERKTAGGFKWEYTDEKRR